MKFERVLDSYCAPKMAIVKIEIESGYRASLENPFQDPEEDW